ncbi:protein vanZ, partial [Enterococcus thailandicus]
MEEMSMRYVSKFLLGIYLFFLLWL